MTLQEMHEQTTKLLADGVPGDTKLATTSDFSNYLEGFSFKLPLTTATTVQGTTYVVLDLGDPRSNDGCYAVAYKGTWTEDENKF